MVRSQRPDLLHRIGLETATGGAQIHLDYVLMGLILIAPRLRARRSAAAAGRAAHLRDDREPAALLPGAFNPANEKKVLFRLIATSSFIAVSVGLRLVRDPRSGLGAFDPRLGRELFEVLSGPRPALLLVVEPLEHFDRQGRVVERLSLCGNRRSVGCPG